MFENFHISMQYYTVKIITARRKNHQVATVGTPDFGSSDELSTMAFDA